MGTVDDGINALPSNPRGLSLRRNFAWTFTGNVIYAVGAPVMLLANLQMRAVQATDAQTRYSFGEHLGLRLITKALAFVVIYLIARLGIYRPEAAAVVFRVGLAKGVESISDVIYGLMRKYERLDRVVIAMMSGESGRFWFFLWSCERRGR